jgi:iron complex transport system ATP-binding protein
MAIKVEKLKFSYGKREILKGVDIHIKKGKLIGILGPNGCGKSTLLKSILGVLKNQEGKIQIGEKGLEEYTQKELAKKLSFVPQKSNLSSPMKVEDFVLMGRLPHLKSSWHGYSKEDMEMRDKTLEELGLEDFRERSAFNLSGGEFQRILLARALTQDPEILLLDEPTSALDLNHAVELMSRVRTMVKKKKITSIAVIHDLNLASMFCDELIIMKDGTVKYKGTPKDILTESVLSEVYNLKCKVTNDGEGNPYVIPLI